MVKNLNGGKKSKSSARKNIIPSGHLRAIRLVDDPLEMYALVTKYMGNGMCHVLCADSRPRLCFIRGKFKGRGKRDNKVETGTWVMIGIREWTSTTSKPGKLESCDLLEVYADQDKSRLKDKEPGVDWGIFAAATKDDRAGGDGELTFSNDTVADDYHELIASATKSSSAPANTASSSASAIIGASEDIFNVDDI